MPSAAPATAIQLRISELPAWSLLRGKVCRKARSLSASALRLARSSSSSTRKWLKPPEASTPIRTSAGYASIARRTAWPSFDQVQGERCIDRIVARLDGLEESGAVANVPVGQAGVGAVLGVAVADGVAAVDRKSGPAVLQIAFVLVVAEHDESVEGRRVERVAQTARRGAGDVLAGNEIFQRHQMGELGIGLFQEVSIGDGPALLVAVLHLLVCLRKARQGLVRRQPHGRMRGPCCKYHLRHPCRLRIQPQ